MEGMSWELIEKQLHVSRRTLYEWRQKDGPWQAAAAEVVAELKAQALPTSYGALVRNAHLGDTQAAKELLNRCEGAVAQSLGLHGVAGEPPVGIQVVIAPPAPKQTEDDGSADTDTDDDHA
jgi:hypothetical protein